MADITTKDIGTEQIKLEKLQFAAQRRLMGHALASLKLDNYKDVMLNELVYTLSTEVISQKLGDEHYEDSQTMVVEYPSSWWQHFKLSYAPEWFNRRWPVGFNTETRTVHFKVKFEAYHKYPEFKAVLPPEHGDPVLYMTTLGDHWE